jgi:ER degradation enhancer, mannosidase alpha-like 2
MIRRSGGFVKAYIGVLVLAVICCLLLVGAVAGTVLSAGDYGAQAAVDREAAARQVRAEFVHAWQGYKKYAWGHDALMPLSRQPRDWYGQSLALTPIDSLDALILLGMKEEAEATRRYIDASVSFDKDVSVSNFEITIRLLGGLLSAHQLTQDPRLLELAEDLAKRLLPVFDSPTGMPYRYVNLKTGKTSGADSNPAEVGTLLLEWGTLSKLTGKPVYYDKAKRALVECYKRRSKIGLVGEGINVETGAWTSPESHISGAIDSYYEYLFKAWRLFGDEECGRMWRDSIQAVQRHLADRRPSGLWYRHVRMETGQPIATRFGALDAFFPALLALSGDLTSARDLQDSCFRMWNVAGIEPEDLDYSTMQIVDAGYPLRPEIIESAYYLRYMTGDARYLDMGRTFLASLVKWCRTDEAYAALSSVESKTKKDEMESFFFAETLKYLYLLFAPDSTLDLRGVILTTEAHPLRRTWK